MLYGMLESLVICTRFLINAMNTVHITFTADNMSRNQIDPYPAARNIQEYINFPW